MVIAATHSRSKASTALAVRSNIAIAMFKKSGVYRNTLYEDGHYSFLYQQVLVETQSRVVYNAPRETRLYIPPRSSTAATRLHAHVQQTLRDSEVAVPIFHGWGASSVGRALRSQRRGRGFNSPALHQPSLKIRLASQTSSVALAKKDASSLVSLRQTGIREA